MKTKINLFNLIILVLLMISLFNSCKKDSDEILQGTVTDIDGNLYKTIKIGDQWWMAENLRVTRFQNGETIPLAINDNDWYSLSISSCCDYENNPSNSQIYGKLYNWYAATDERKMCPTGWHVPTDAEWSELIDYLGGELVAGGKLKEVGTLHWNSPNNGATNESGFTALPGGYRDDDGSFDGIGNRGFLWSSTENGDYAWSRSLGYANGYCLGKNDNFFREYGFSVRCIKD